MPYQELLDIQTKSNIKTKSIFNLWESKGHKSNLLKYVEDTKNIILHRNQSNYWKI